MLSDKVIELAPTVERRFLPVLYMLSSVIVISALWHLGWGIMMLVEPPTGSDATGGAAWNIFVRTFGCNFWGWWMIGGSLLAGVGMVYHDKRWSTLLFMPQQFPMVFAFAGGFTNLLGVWDDFALSRVLRSSYPGMLMCVGHTCAILVHLQGGYRWSLRKH